MAFATLLLRGLITGILAAFVILYALRPGMPYPQWMITLYDHPWVFLVLFAIIAYIALMDVFIGALLMIAFVALAADMYLFGRPINRESGEPSVGGGDVPMAVDVAATMGDVIGKREGWDIETGSLAGPALATVPTPMLNYSLFGLEDPQPGEPAPFP